MTDNHDAPLTEDRDADPGSADPPPRAARPWRAKWIALALITLAVCATDQLSKEWAQKDLQLRPGRRVTLIEGYLNFSYVRNPGAAWGFLSRSSESFRRPFFITVSLVAMIFILYLFVRLEPGQQLLMIALSLVMGGAIGNFIDRLRYSYVVDFIDCHLKTRFKWPTFNVADIAITVGVLFLFTEMFILPIVRQRRARIASAAAPASIMEDGSPEEEELK